MMSGANASPTGRSHQEMKRVVITGAVLLAFAGVALRQADGQQLSNPTGSRQAAQHRALVNQYCATCHNEKLKTGDLMLDKLDLEHEKPIAEIQTPQPRSQVDQKLSKYNLPWILLGLIGLLILL